MTNMSSIAADPPPASDADGAQPDGAELAELLGHLKESERHLAAAVLLAGRLAGSGVAERVEGLPLDLLLGLAGRQTGADRRVLIAAGEALGGMPKTAALLSQGQLSWGQIRAIARAARRLSAAQRAWLDARIAATAEERDLSRADPDELLWAVDAAADELRTRREAERDERARERDCFFSVQSNFAGGARIFADLPDPVIAAPIIAALDAAAGPPRKDGRRGRPAGARDGSREDPASPSEHGGAGVGGPAAHQEPGAAPEDGAQRVGDSGWSPPSRSRQYAAALADICAAWLGGGSGQPARPLFVVNVDLAQVQLHSDGTVALAVRGDLPRISAAALERLVNDADLKAVLFDGARPLAASRKTRMRDIPQATRTAIAARDRGCRFPGSPDPLAHTDVHHLKERSRGGDHSPDNLAALSRRFHTLVHERGWTLILHPDSGQITVRRGERAWTSMPKGTRLAQPDDPADAAGLGEPAAGVRGRPPDPDRPSPGRGRGDDASNGHDPPMAYPRDPSLPF